MGGGALPRAANPTARRAGPPAGPAIAVACDRAGLTQAKGRVPMQPPDLSQTDTTAKLLLHNAAHWGGRGRAAREGLRHLARLQLGRLPAARGGAGARPAGAGHRARRRGRHHRAQPAALAVGGARGAQRRRDVARHLRGRARQGGAVSARLCRGAARVRRGRGAGRQGPGDRGRAAGAALDRLQRRARHAQIRRPAPAEPRAADPARQGPARRALRAGGRRGHRRRGRAAVHHLGHDRASQARDAAASAAARARHLLSARRAARALRRVRLDPAAAVDRRAGLRRADAAAVAHPGQFPARTRAR